MTIGQKIKQIRKEKGLTQKELAQKLGFTSQNLAQYENGKRLPKTETLKKIANVLEVSIFELDESLFFNTSLDSFAGSPKFDESINKNVQYTMEEVDRADLELNNQTNNIECKKTQPDDKVMLSYFHKANDLGKEKIIDYATDIVENPKYRKGTK
jgi:transcriptional regulator with XRE-family HTH domain